MADTTATTGGTTIPLNFDIPLDRVSQQLKIYTQLSLVYKLPDGTSIPNIVQSLKSGLQRLTRSFPWVAGQVSCNTSTGICSIRPFNALPRFDIKYLQDDPAVPSLEDMRAAKFPFPMFAEEVVAPRRTLPGYPDEADVADIYPVFLMQANFIKGGLILTFVTAHSTMDISGQGQLMDLFSKACRDEPFTQEELASGNLNSRDLVALLDESYEPSPEFKSQIIQPDQPAPLPPVSCQWAYFSFSPASLAALKAEASKSLPSTCKFVSTDDTLTAYIWQSIMRARLPRLDPQRTVRITRTVDMRQFLCVPKTYVGLLMTLVYQSWSLRELVNESLGVVAAAFRAALVPEDLVFRTRALATYYERIQDKSKISVTAGLELDADLMISSWAKPDCYEIDCGLGLGKPEAVRRPMFTPVESLIYFMPKRTDGEIAVGMGLRDEDLGRLREDTEFSKFATYIG